MDHDTISSSELPSAQRDRWNRAKSDGRIYVLDVLTIDDDSSGRYLLTMQGTTDVYTISVPVDGVNPLKCSCLDAGRRKDCVCKHVLAACITFGFLYTEGSPDSIITRCPDSTIARNLLTKKQVVLSPSEVERLVAALTFRTFSSTSGTSRTKTSLFDMEDPCAICFEDIKKSTAIFECSTCKKCIHDDCWKAWKRGGKTTCVYCRATN